MKKSKKTVIIALGGNALSQKDESGTIDEQFAHARESLKGVMLVRGEDKLMIAKSYDAP